MSVSLKKKTPTKIGNALNGTPNRKTTSKPKKLDINAPISQKPSFEGFFNQLNTLKKSSIFSHRVCGFGCLKAKYLNRT